MKENTEKIVLLQVENLISIIFILASDRRMLFRYINLYTEGISKLSSNELNSLLICNDERLSLKEGSKMLGNIDYCRVLGNIRNNMMD